MALREAVEEKELFLRIVECALRVAVAVFEEDLVLVLVLTVEREPDAENEAEIGGRIFVTVLVRSPKE